MIDPSMLKPSRVLHDIIFEIWEADRAEATVEPSSQQLKVRPPAAAGLFYASDPERLQASVAELIGAVEASPAVLTPKALIAPHAGYVYSGSVAAEAFARLRAAAEAIRRVVLVGPAHFVPLRGIAAPTVEAFATPLGRIPVDRQALAAIADLVVAADAPHTPEHSLEVELPFLQAVLPSFALVPLVIGDASAKDVAEVLRRLWGGPETAIVVSSDLSHYHDYDTARRLDAATAAAIEGGAWQSLGPEKACGFLAVAGLIVETNRRGLTPRRLALCNSGDTAGRRERVVGYGAWMVEEMAAHQRGGSRS
jgi:AmmeMemoRadiSam system protein B